MANNRRSIGATISLGGESQFRRAVTNCNASLRTMRSEMQLVSEQYRGQANSMEALQARHQTLERTLERSTALQSTLQEALANAESNYANAGAQMDAYRRQLDEATQSLASLEAQQSDVADDDLTQRIEEQRAEMQRLNDIVERGQRAYETAENNVERWRQQLNSASTEVIRLQRELDDNNRYLQEAEQSSDHLATSIDGMGRAVCTASNEVEESATDTADSVEQLTENTSQFFTTEVITEYAEKVSDAFQELATAAWESAKQIDEAYDTVARKTGASGKELDKYKDIVNSIYSDVPSEINEIGRAVGETARYFKAPAEEIESFSEKLIKFGYINETEVSETLLGTSRIITAFGGSIKDADKLLDTLTASAQDAGLQIDDVLDNTLTNAAAFKELNLDASGAVKFMSALMESGVEAESAVSSLENAYDTCKEQGKDFAKSLLEVNDRLRDGQVTTEDMAMAQELFGDGFAKMSDAIKSGNVDFRALITNMNDTRDATGRVDKTFKATKDAYDDVSLAMQNLKSISGELTKEAFDTMAPAIQGLADLLKGVDNLFDNLPDGMKTTVSVLGAIVAGCGILAPKVLAVKVAIDGLRAANGVTEALNRMSGATAASATTAETAAASTATLATTLRTVAPIALGVAGAIGVAKIAYDAASDAAEEAAQTIIDSDADLSRVLETSQKYLDNMTAVRDSISATRNDYDTMMSELSVKQDMALPLVSEFSALQSQSDKTEYELSQMSYIVDELNTLYPDLRLEVDASTGSLKANGKTINDLASYMRRYSNEIEETAKKQALLQYKKDEVQAEIDYKVSQKSIKAVQAQIVDELKKAGINSVEEFNSMNFAERFALNFNPDVNVQVIDELINRTHELEDSQHDLASSYDDAKSAVETIEKELGLVSDTTEQATTNVEKNSESWTGAGAQVDAAAQKYVDLAVKIADAGGDIDVVAQSFQENEGALKSLFEETSLAWQTSHDEITNGLADEVTQLQENAGQWKQYKDDIESSVKSVSEIFSMREEDADITWQTMQNGLVSNANAYELWLANTNAVLESARYANDEAFREIANTIMSAGIDSADYLDDFVQNVNLNTTQAKDDIARFTELSEYQERYAGYMANLKLATDENIGGIAQTFVDTKSVAQQSMEEMSNLLDERAEMYNEYAENAQKIVESERYKTDEDFRAYANTLLQQGIAGAEQVSTLWENLAGGSAQVDAAVEGYLALQESIGAYADVWASVQNTMQYGVDGTVMIIDSAGEAWKQSAINDEIMLANGITGDKAVSAVQSMTEKTIAELSSSDTQEEYYNAGKLASDAYAAGLSGSPLVSQYDGTGPLASLLHPMQYKNNTSHNTMNLTVQNNNDGNFIQDVTRWMKKIFK